MSNTVKIIIGVVLVAVLAGGAVVIATGGDSSNNSSQQQAQNPGPPETKNSPSNPGVALTAEEVSKHNSASDCWTIIRGTVYDVTDFISRHPGGDEILRACGIDATTLFESRMTQSGETVGSGTPHSSSAQAQLDQFELGPLEQ